MINCYWSHPLLSLTYYLSDTNAVGLWWSAVTSSLAAVLSLAGACHGLSRHRFARTVLGVSVAAAALSYWVDILGEYGLGAEMRRGASYVLWPSLLWVAWTGISYMRAREAMVQQILEGVRDE
jgi:hypothetical protein